MGLGIGLRKRDRAGPVRGRLRLLVVIDSLGLGGAESLLLPMVKAAPTAGIDVDVVSFAGAGDPRQQMVPLLRALGVEPRYLAAERLLSPLSLPRLVRTILATKADVVHAHLENAITLAALAGRITRRPTICTFHHNPHDLAWRDATRERLAVQASSRCARTIFVSFASMRGWAGRYPAHPNWTVVPNGVDLTEFAPSTWPQPLPEDLGIAPGAPVALLAASMRGAKGHEAAIAAWPAVLARVPEAVLLLAGSGDRKLGLQARARALGLGRSVVFAGFRTDMAQLARGAALVLLPSESEALPTVLIEAAASARPVVASDVGGIPEVVDDGTTGLLVAPDDHEALSRAVADLLSDPVRREMMGIAAHARASQHFGSGSWMARLREIYDEALAGARR
ncbi:MAG: glycosyltransferase family 4 protein [Actinomycetota bacterium]|nr:glycosyltransferase family 4 protein [Actinomycetota bacterium]